MLLGSSREFVGLDPSINRRIRAKMVRRALEFAARSRAALGPPHMGRLPAGDSRTTSRSSAAWDATPGLFIAAGHEGLGITTAPATGRLVADAILGRRSPIDPAPYSPMRSFPAADDAHA